MRHSKVLIIDAVINFALGIILLLFPEGVINFLGVPMVESAFYPSIFGGVLIGIGIALLVEYFRNSGGMIGLGLGGAIAINICGGLVLAFWLLSGALNIPLHGKVFLWGLVVMLVIISGIELFIYLRKRCSEVTK